MDWIEQCLTSPRQHSIGYMGDGFYRSKDPTNSIKVLKEQIHRKIKHTKADMNTRQTDRQTNIMLLTAKVLINLLERNVIKPLVHIMGRGSKRWRCCLFILSVCLYVCTCKSTLDLHSTEGAAINHDARDGAISSRPVGRYTCSTTSGYKCCTLFIS